MFKQVEYDEAAEIQGVNHNGKYDEGGCIMRPGQS